MKLLTLVATGALNVTLTFGATYTIKNGASDWTSPGSYAEGGKPNSGDMVTVPAGARVALDAADTASWSLVESLSRIVPEAPDSVLAVNVEDDAATLTTPFSATTTLFDGRDTSPDAGELVKTGAGNLNLGSATGRYLSSGNRYDYYTALTVEGGTMTLPQAVTPGGAFYYGKVKIGAEGMLVNINVANSSVGAYASVRTLSGNGTLTASGTCQFHISSCKEVSEFAGKLSGTVRMQLEGAVRLLGTESDTTGYYASYCNYGSLVGGYWGGWTEVAKFGKIGESSSLGASGDLRTGVYGGGFRFVGSSDECDKFLCLRESVACDGYNFIDGGPNGGLNWTGTWGMLDGEGEYTKTHRLILTGTNRNECVMSGPIHDGKIVMSATKTAYFPIYIIKRGSGTWHMADNADRTGGGTYAIEEGTLKYDSIAEKGDVCSLGTANNLTEEYTNPAGTLIDDIESHRVDYAILLGSATGGTMEFCGANGGSCSTRPVAVKGKGRFKVSGAGDFAFCGFSAYDDGAELILDTDRADGVTIGNIANGDGHVLKVTKVGAGNVTFDSDLSFTGGLDVKEGAVRVLGANRPYRFFRWIVKERGRFCSRYPELNLNDYSLNMTLQMQEVALFDADGHRLDSGLTDATLENGIANMPAGSVATESTFQSTKNPTLSTWFDGTSSGSSVTGGVYPFTKLDTPSYWFKFIERLPDRAGTPASFDLIGIAKYAGASKLAAAFDITAIAIEGSVDGVSWEPVVDQSLDLPTEDGNRWYSKPTDASLGFNSDHQGFPMRGTSTAGVSSIAAPVSVAQDASLAVSEGDVTLSALRLSATANGTISGFKLADAGTIDIVDYTGGSVRIPVVMADVKNLAALENWTLTINGQENRGRTISVAADGTVTLNAVGMAVIIR